MQLSAPQHRKHRVLMSFRYRNAWDVIFFDTDRILTAIVALAIAVRYRPQLPNAGYDNLVSELLQLLADPD